MRNGETPHDLRLAKILAAELNNIAEHYWKLVYPISPDKVGSTKTPTEYRDHLAAILPGFGLIRDVADSHKHLFLDRTSAKVKSNNDITVETIGFGQGYGLCYGGGEIVAARLKNGETAYFDVFAERVYQYWKALVT